MSDTRRVLLVRHAKAEADAGDGDLSRGLTARGRRDAAALGRWLADHDLVPDLVLCSSAVRAQETWTAAASELDDPPPVRVEPSLYEASVAAVLDVVAATSDVVRTLAVVGHDPTTSEVAVALAGEASDGGAVAAVRAGLPTSGVVVLEVVGGWDQVVGGSAALVLQAAPRG